MQVIVREKNTLWRWTKSSIAKRVFSIARWLHVYCSTLLFGLLVFFSLTGIFLNHVWYDGERNRVAENEYMIEASQAQAWSLRQADEHAWKPKLDLISSYLSEQFGLPEPSSINLDSDFGELSYEYKVPAGFATVLIESESGIIYVNKEQGSLVGVLNDLHKGRHSETVWGWVIDVSAGLMILFGLTGLIILFQGKKYRKGGLISALLGLITPVAIYYLFVPYVSV